MSGIFSGKRALLLDFDGTLGDTFSLHEAAFKTALEPYSLPFEYAAYIGQSTGEVFDRIFEQAGRMLAKEDRNRLIGIKRQAANDLYATHLRFVNGAEAFVQKAHQLGYQLFIGSSGSKRNIMAGIEGLGIGRYITTVVTADDVTYGKPHPEIFQLLLQMGGLSAGESLVVEDAPSGLQAAITAGIDVVCIDPALENAAFSSLSSVHFATFAQLLEVLIPPAKIKDASQ